MAVYKELSDKIKFGLNKMGITARKLQLGEFLDNLGSFGKLTVDFEKGHKDIELLEEDLPANNTVFIEAVNSNGEAKLIVPSGVLKLYIVRNSTGNTLNFTPKGGEPYPVEAGTTTVLAETTEGEFSPVGGGGEGGGPGVDNVARANIAQLSTQVNDIANQIEELQNSGVDTEARASIAQLESQINDVMTYENQVWEV